MTTKTDARMIKVMAIMVAISSYINIYRHMN